MYLKVSDMRLIREYVFGNPALVREELRARGILPIAREQFTRLDHELSFAIEDINEGLQK